MFIVIEYASPRYPNIVRDEDGMPMLFASENKAIEWAGKNCAFDYVIVFMA